MTTSGHLSIGEVLTLLHDEFPDVTISKIRFLESQGLIDPERTPSGYRKFYASDVERLRFILRTQRDQFLPLKVIKDRLVEGEGEGDEPEGGEPEAPVEGEVEAVPVAAAAPAAEPAPEPAAGPLPAPEPAVAPAAEAAEEPDPDAPINLTREELARAAGATLEQIKELEGFGMVTGRDVGRVTYYDEDALAVVKLAAAFRRFGVEARHLRAYKTAAEREAGTFEALVLPLLKQRNPQARKQAAETLDELSQLGEGLRAAMLRLALRDVITP